jgi:hypothetical protein
LPLQETIAPSRWGQPAIALKPAMGAACFLWRVRLAPRPQRIASLLAFVPLWRILMDAYPSFGVFLHIPALGEHLN